MSSVIRFAPTPVPLWARLSLVGDTLYYVKIDPVWSNIHPRNFGAILLPLV
jgi:hypothetical protein